MAVPNKKQDHFANLRLIERHLLVVDVSLNVFLLSGGAGIRGLLIGPDRLK